MIWDDENIISFTEVCLFFSTGLIFCSQRAFMKYRIPLREIVVDFYNELKSLTSGYASFDYEDAE